MDRTPSLQERRKSLRQAAVDNRCRIESVTPYGRRRASAILVDISLEGALLATGEPPAVGERIWLRMEEPARTDWFAAVAVRRDTDTVGLRFVEPRPDELLLAATLGIDIGPTLRGGPKPESIDDFVW